MWGAENPEIQHGRTKNQTSQRSVGKIGKAWQKRWNMNLTLLSCTCSELTPGILMWLASAVWTLAVSWVEILFLSDISAGLNFSRMSLTKCVG